MPTKYFLPAVDVYINQSPAFAQPILRHLRELTHKACPQVEEAIKWSRPFFLHRGTILANMSAFKHHCSFGFWGQEMTPTLQAAGALKPGAMGTLGKITQLSDLPSNKQMLAWIIEAAAAIDSGTQISPIAARAHRVVKAPKNTIPTPEAFSTALAANPEASTHFAAFSPSCQREYTEWIAEAKRPETQNRRIAEAITWVAEGKQRHWKYQPHPSTKSP